MYKNLPEELINYIIEYSGNKCSICQNKVFIPYKRISKYYYCRYKCFVHF